MMAMQYGFLLAAVITAYWLWIRPILKSRPELKDLWDREESLFTALRERFKGIKGKLLTALGIVGGIVIELHDTLLPAVTGVDIGPIKAMLPEWAWPLLMVGMFWLIGRFRAFAEKRSEQESDDNDAAKAREP